jgi:hypothetical protein
MKRIHGEPIPPWKKLGLQQFPPIECNLSVGDEVVYTNTNGCSFDSIVIGFSENANFYGRFIHIFSYGADKKIDEGAWWFPHTPQELTKK